MGCLLARWTDRQTDATTTDSRTDPAESRDYRGTRTVPIGCRHFCATEILIADHITNTKFGTAALLRPITVASLISFLALLGCLGPSSYFREHALPLPGARLSRKIFAYVLSVLSMKVTLIVNSLGGVTRWRQPAQRRLLFTCCGWVC